MMSSVLIRSNKCVRLLVSYSVKIEEKVGYLHQEEVVVLEYLVLMMV